MINFMATHGRGLICAPLSEERCEHLGLDLMVNANTTPFETPFTVSIDLVGHGVSTGISATDRALTIQALTWPEKRRCTSPCRAHRSGHRFCTPCGATPGRRHLRNHEPRRQHGAPARTSGGG
jgi:3,4-dihydroxy 2-butanone 4-phosphate synthase/GTP cyclohydrolase II